MMGCSRGLQALTMNLQLLSLGWGHLLLIVLHLCTVKILITGMFECVIEEFEPIHKSFYTCSLSKFGEVLLNKVNQMTKVLALLPF